MILGIGKLLSVSSLSILTLKMSRVEFFPFRLLFDCSVTRKYVFEETTFTRKLRGLRAISV